MNHTLGDRWYVHYAHGRDSRPAEDKLSYPAGRIIILSVDSPDNVADQEASHPT